MSKKRKTSEVVFEYTGEREDVPRNVTIVRFHSSVTEVGDLMFDECRQLKKVVLNDGLQKIGRYAFYNCDKLKYIDLTSTLVEIDTSAFKNCSNLRELVLNEGLQKLGERSFGSCLSLQSVLLPSTVTEIGAKTFYKCQRLRRVVLNETLQTIGVAAFASCLSLERITIPPATDEIKERSFYNCSNLREVELHKGIQKISPTAFHLCPSLERFTFPNLSIRIDNITRFGQTEVENKVDALRDLIERSGSELFVSVSSRDWGINWQGGDWKTVKGSLGRIDRILTYYEVKEATTLFELAIWKAKMDQAEAIPLINRGEYRVGERFYFAVLEFRSITTWSILDTIRFT